MNTSFYSAHGAKRPARGYGTAATDRESFRNKHDTIPALRANLHKHNIEFSDARIDSMYVDAIITVVELQEFT